MTAKKMFFTFQGGKPLCQYERRSQFHLQFSHHYHSELCEYCIHLCYFVMHRFVQFMTYISFPALSSVHLPL